MEAEFLKTILCKCFAQLQPAATTMADKLALLGAW